MPTSIESLAARAKEKFEAAMDTCSISHGELTLEIKRSELLRVCRILRDGDGFEFKQLIDICGVDYLSYGHEEIPVEIPSNRYASVYHLLSIAHNQRIRLRVFLDNELPMVDSVVDIWNSANWFEREAFDLFGIVYEGHPDLRRILTDYGFVGHPFRKDFPLSGHVEMRYDADKGRVVYQPVTIKPRVLVPRVIREEGYSGRDT